jgi:hypothetical protein
MDADTIITPSHYAQYVIEPVEYIMVNDMDFWRGNVIKYASRAGKKMYHGKSAAESEITDLHKAMRYLEMRINVLNEEGIL